MGSFLEVAELLLRELRLAKIVEIVRAIHHTIRVRAVRDHALRVRAVQAV